MRVCGSMHRDNLRSFEDRHLVFADVNLQALMHEAMRDAVTNRFTVDEAIACDSATKALLANRQTSTRESA